MKSQNRPAESKKITLTRKTLVKLAGSDKAGPQPQFARPCTPACSYFTGAY